MEQKLIVKQLAALAQDTRLSLFRALVVAGSAGLTPGVLAERLALAPATLSFHLKELSHAGLVSAEQQGRHIVYRADYSAMHALLGFLTDNCCEGQPCAPSGCC